MKDTQYSVRQIGVVRSALKSREDCPNQGYEGAPEARLEIDPAFTDAMDGLKPEQEILILSWFHLGRRDLLKVHPRGNPMPLLKGYLPPALQTARTPSACTGWR